MLRIITTMTRGARAAWWWLRQVLGDAAYENYLRSTSRLAARNSMPREVPPAVIPLALRPTEGSAARNPSCATATARILTREEFYLDALRRRYSGVSRCC